MKKFLARQPIFDKSQNVFAYELLFRSGIENSCEGIDHEAASTSMADTSFLFGLQKLTEGRRAFVNCPRQFLLSDYISLFPRDFVVVELLENVTPDAEVLAACRRLKQKGYLLALDDFTGSPVWNPVIPFADFIKVDFRLTSREQQRSLALRLGARGIRMLAEKVETQEEAAEAVKMGYALFQGFYFCRPQMMAHLFPFTDLPQKDPETGQADALHRRLDARQSPLKIMYTNTSAEYHRGDASLIHTSADGVSDVAHGPNTRIYHYAGTEHSLGAWPPTNWQIGAADPTGAIDHSQNLRGVVDYSRLLRACLVSLDRWVTDGEEPPPSVHPRLTDGSAVAPEDLAKVFDAIPDAHYPRHHPRPLRLDFGASGELRETPTIPPRRGRPYGSRVSAVDADGNEIGGIHLPEISVPLATYTGWNLRDPSIGGASQRVPMEGSYLPFPKDAAAQKSSGDPRKSIAERYANREAYLQRFEHATDELIQKRWILPEDRAPLLQRGGEEWDSIVR